MKANKIKPKKKNITHSPLKQALFSQFVIAMTASLVLTGSACADQVQLPSFKMATPIEIPGDDKLKRMPPLVGATPIEIPGDDKLKRMTPPSDSHSHGGRSHSHPLPAQGVAHRHGNGAVGH